MWLSRTRPAAAASDAGASATTLTTERLTGLAATAAPPRQAAYPSRGLTHLPGMARTRLRGRGLEFDDLRPYAEGDDIRHIDWNVMARTGRPFTRQFREERERAVTVAVDFRASMLTGSRRFKSVAAGELAAGLLWRISAERDRAGALVFDDRETVATQPASRDRGPVAAIGAIAALHGASRARAAAMETPRSLDAVLAFINQLRRGAGAIVLLTGLDDPGEGVVQELREAGRRQRLSIVLLRDPIEIDGVPEGGYAYRAHGAAGYARLDRGAAARLAEVLAARHRRTLAMLERSGVPYVDAATTIEAGDLFAALRERGMI